MESDLLEKCREVLSTDSRLILFGIRRDYYDDKDKLIRSICSFEDERGTEVIELNKSYNSIFRKYDIASPCNKIYDKEIISKHKLKFNEACCCLEDFMFNLSYLEHVIDIFVLKKDLYCYRLLISKKQIFKRQFSIPFENASYVYQSIKKFESVKKIPFSEMDVLYGIAYTQFVNEFLYFSKKNYCGKEKKLIKILNNNKDYKQLINFLHGNYIRLLRMTMRLHLYKIQKLLLWRRK